MSKKDENKVYTSRYNAASSQAAAKAALSARVDMGDYDQAIIMFAQAFWSMFNYNQMGQKGKLGKDFEPLAPHGGVADDPKLPVSKLNDFKNIRINDSAETETMGDYMNQHSFEEPEAVIDDDNVPWWKKAEELADFKGGYAKAAAAIGPESDLIKLDEVRQLLDRNALPELPTGRVTVDGSLDEIVMAAGLIREYTTKAKQGQLDEYAVSLLLRVHFTPGLESSIKENVLIYLPDKDVKRWELLRDLAILYDPSAKIANRERLQAEKVRQLS